MSACTEEPSPVLQVPEQTSESLYSTGMGLLDRGEGEAAFEHLSRCYLADPQVARYRSGYALALALIRGQFLGAADLARAAVRQEYHDPELYLNLARIYRAFDFRAESVRYLRRGLMVDPGHRGIEVALVELGVRRPPPIRFLPRGHLLNRLIGRLQARVGRSTTDSAPSQSQA